ncbi:hypothetical protein EWE75_03725 [Sphingomonas populi]|uniref:Uncharacterized protein n=1 Tax=Sphingomonas populi TaxID=2484750 RepID=A0A4V2DDQ2_9SPHN|nr:hypothetical protein [Sphingomonas populi]RZF65778.1 hypothetical protein EWE75_03725 [Sphingomonas populi]
MQNRVPTARPALDFEPVPRKYRYDGWTAERQRAFIAALAETGSVKAAATRINMSYEGAYYLRRQPGADGFRAAWIAALDHGVQRLADIAIERAIEGVPVPIHWRGEQVGEKRRYNDRLLMFILRHHLADRYGGPGLAHGTRNPETIAREAAENCPVCKARAAEAEAAEAATAEKPKADRSWLERTLKLYIGKVVTERNARREGDFAGADFAMRQIFYMEMMLDCAGAPEAVLALWSEGTMHDLPTHTTPVCKLLDRARRAAWADDGLIRPPVKLPAQAFGSPAMHGGLHMKERYAAQDAACRRMAEAQALWEAAATEEGWAAWCGEGGG